MDKKRVSNAVADVVIMERISRAPRKRAGKVDVSKALPAAKKAKTTTAGGRPKRSCATY